MSTSAPPVSAAPTATIGAAPTRVKKRRTSPWASRPGIRARPPPPSRGPITSHCAHAAWKALL